MRMAKRLTLQLTPLLDLLLIVIFAQYMDVQSKIDTTQASLRSQVQESEQQTRRLNIEMELRTAELLRLQSEVDRLAKSAADSESSSNELRNSLIDLQREFEMASRQRDEIGDLVQKLLQLSEAEMNASLQETRELSSPTSAAAAQRAQQQLKKLADANDAELVRHLLTYNELSKRSDIWQIHIDSQGVIHFRPNEKTYSFRAASPQAFQRELFNNYKSLPQPKSLVIIIVSYGDARADVREAVLGGLPAVSDQMRADTNGRSRFEYAVLGYRPDDG